MIYIFDLDGTLIEGFLPPVDPVTKEFPSSPAEQVHPYERIAWLPGRIDRLLALDKAGHRLGIATNQSGPAFGHQTEATVQEKVMAALDYLSQHDIAIYAEWCCHHPNALVRSFRRADELPRRKPEPGMLHSVARTLAEGEPQRVVYVGDSMTDFRTAGNAVCEFAWADEFFDRP